MIYIENKKRKITYLLVGYSTLTFNLEPRLLLIIFPNIFKFKCRITNLANVSDF